MKHRFLHLAVAAAVCALGSSAHAALVPAGIFNGNVGLSVDGIGSNSTPVGSVQADIPVGATVLQAYLYSAGTPFPWYSDSPTTLAAYNGAGITLAGNAITNFDTLVGATSTLRPDIGQWFTGRADVTSLVQSLVTGAVSNNFSWQVGEGSLNNRIDGEVLAIVYSHPSLPVGSVALLNGGQDTAGETTTVNLGAPLSDPTAPGFAAELGFAISFSCCNQASTVSVNGSPVTSNAGNNDDGLAVADGSLITVGGLGDPAANSQSYANDREKYNLAPFFNTGDTSFSIFTRNATGDDNIFFASLYLTGNIRDVNPPDPNPMPEPATYALMLAALGMLGFRGQRRKEHDAAV